jgi:hypothetical protein
MINNFFILLKNIFIPNLIYYFFLYTCIIVNGIYLQCMQNNI